MESSFEDILGRLVSFLGIGMVWLNEMSMQTHSSFFYLKGIFLILKLIKFVGLTIVV